MVRINFVAEDTLRDLVYKCVNGYSDMIHRFCPDSVNGKLYYGLPFVVFYYHQKHFLPLLSVL